MKDAYVRAVYRIETMIGAEKAAEVLAGEQSTGTFVRVEGESDALRARHGARVVSVVLLGTASSPSLPGAASDGNGQVEVARVVIDFPLANFGPSVPNLLAAVAGNLFELRELAGCRLEDIEVPSEFADAYPGPRFGVVGTRRLAQAPEGALVGGIIKPSVGLSPAEHAARVEALALAGADFCKDDELIADPPYSPLSERVPHVMRAIERAADRTGRKLMYAFNITGELGDLRRRHDLVVGLGGTCVMVCVNMVGMPGVRYLREWSEVPIHGHRAMFGALSRHPSLGIGFRAFQKLARLAGVDHLHTNGMDNKFYETNDEVRLSIEAVVPCRSCTTWCRLPTCSWWRGAGYSPTLVGRRMASQACGRPGTPQSLGSRCQCVRSGADPSQRRCSGSGRWASRSSVSTATTSRARRTPWPTSPAEGCRSASCSPMSFASGTSAPF
jgi:ribulose-bisphosphate carboxylase large chain